MLSGKSKQNQQVFQEQVAHLYHFAPLSLLFTVLNGIILIILLAGLFSNHVLISWICALFTVTAFRALLVYFYNRNRFSHQSVTRWYRLFLVGTFLSGLVWAGSAIVLFSKESIEHQMLVVFVIAGMTAASVSVLSARITAFFLFVLPILLTLAYSLFTAGHEISAALSLMVFFYLVGISLAAKGANHLIHNSLRLRFDNYSLVGEIEERQQAEDELYQQKERLQITFSAMAEGVVTTSVNGIIEYINPAVERMFGWSPQDIVGKQVQHVFMYYDENTGQSTDGAITICLTEVCQSKKINAVSTSAGDRKIVEEVATPLKDRNGKMVGSVAIVRDITLASEHKRQLAYQASHDIVTGLPNRILLLDRLEHAFNKALRSNSQVAVLYLDLDRFKHINDSFGHAAGDQLLLTVSQRLCTTIRQEDTVARIGGDEFVLVLEGLATMMQANVVAEKIIENLALPVVIENQKITVGVSIGISLYPDDGNSVETLLKNADTAMYQAKLHVGSGIRFYTNQMGESVNTRLALENKVQKAISDNQLDIYYQPRVNTVNGRIEGNEALVRWLQPEELLISTAEFIDIAESTGAIVQISQWILLQACQQAQEWLSLGHELQISVNLSIRQVLDFSIVNVVKDVLNETGLEPGRLELEINENLFLQDPDFSINVLKKIKSLGVKLAIDNFGSGYSSLPFIKQIPIDIVKIDKIFVNEISKKSSDTEVLNAIINLAHNLSLEIVAKGVENEEQRQYLADRRCYSYHGFYFSKPLPSHAITNLLEQNHLDSDAISNR
ncbi:MAG: EAL domain-containing protein [Gammaproteobacteria bacterium]|nr:EAL domain-containing protein [Gammaproteobacteria bacterium]